MIKKSKYYYDRQDAQNKSKLPTPTHTNAPWAYSGSFDKLNNQFHEAYRTEIFQDETMVLLATDADYFFKKKYPLMYKHILNVIPKEFRVMNSIWTQFGLTGGLTETGNCESHKDKYSLINLIYQLKEDAVTGGNTRFFDLDDLYTAFDITGIHLRKILGPFNKTEHCATTWANGKRGCIGFYVHKDILLFFHQFKLAPLGSATQFVERPVHEMENLRKSFLNSYREIGAIEKDSVYLNNRSNKSKNVKKGY